jgi:thiamine-monophosphate kinase
MTVAELTERELIARIQRRLPPAPEWLLVGPGDDSAVVEPERNRVEVLSVDCLVDTVHFDRKFVPADAIGHRALAVNLSDLAAMGASPRFALLSFALPKTLPVVDFDGIVDGVTALATRHRMHIAGGNLTSTPGPLTVDVTVIGTVKRRQALTRGGARPGDELYVTGAVGSARAALEQLRTGRTSALAAAYLRPEARLRVGTLLARNRVASACMDLSDGLADAVRQVAGASGVGAHIEADAVPIEPLAREWFEAQQQDPVFPALAGGDDYELLFAVRPHLRTRLAAVRRLADVPITRIGVCTAAPELVVSSSNGSAAPLPPGYGHFR